MSSWWEIRNQGFLDFILDPADVSRSLYQHIHELHFLGIIKQDPKLPVDKILPPPSPWPKSSIFDADEEKSKVRSFSLTMEANLESEPTSSLRDSPPVPSDLNWHVGRWGEFSLEQREVS